MISEMIIINPISISLVESHWCPNETVSNYDSIRFEETLAVLTV